MQKIKILILSTNADLAGAPLNAKEIALSLKRDGHDVVVVFGSNGLTQEALYAAGIKTYIAQGMRSSINPIADFWVYRSLVRIVQTEQPDLIHCHSAKAGMLGRLVAARLKIPCVYTVHGWGFGVGRKPIAGLILKILEYVLSGLTSHFIAVSESDRQVGIDRLGISKEKITTIRNGVSYAISSPDLRPIKAKVIMVARNCFQKDYITLARALSKSDIYSAIFVGEKTDAPEFKAEIEELSRNSCYIDFCGVRLDIPKLLEASSIFVLSSRYEALPLSIIEAMSKGLPIVASDVGGVRELVLHGVNGYLFPSGDFEMLSKYLNILAQDVDLRRSMGIESIRRYQTEFSAERMMGQVLRVYQKVLSVNQK